MQNLIIVTSVWLAICYCWCVIVKSAGYSPLWGLFSFLPGAMLLWQGVGEFFFYGSASIFAIQIVLLALSVWPAENAMKLANLMGEKPSKKNAYAAMDLAERFAKKGKLDKACGIYKLVAEKFPDSAPGNDARTALATIAEKSAKT